MNVARLAETVETVNDVIWGSLGGKLRNAKRNEEGFIRSAINVRNLNPCKTQHFASNPLLVDGLAPCFVPRLGKEEFIRDGGSLLSSKFEVAFVPTVQRRLNYLPGKNGRHGVPPGWATPCSLQAKMPRSIFDIQSP